MKKLISSLFLLVVMAIFNGSITHAKIYNVAGKEVHILGQISQVFNYGFALGMVGVESIEGWLRRQHFR